MPKCTYQKKIRYTEDGYVYKDGLEDHCATEMEKVGDIMTGLSLTSNTKTLYQCPKCMKILLE